MGTLARTALPTPLVLTLATLLPAQGYGTPQELVGKRDAKLKAAFLGKAPWRTDYDKALADARSQDKLILTYFTRSYQESVACDALEAGALSDPRMESLGEQAILFTHITSYAPDEPHPRLLVEKGGTRFPAIMILDQQGEVITRLTEDEHNVEALARLLPTATAWLRLKARAEAGHRDIATELFIADLRLHKLRLDEAMARHQKLEDLTEAQVAEISQSLVDLEFEWYLKGFDEDSSSSFEQKLLRMKQAGRIPSGRNGEQFWIRLMQHAQNQKNADLLEECIDGMRRDFGDVPRYQMLLQRMAEVLRELRG